MSATPPPLTPIPRSLREAAKDGIQRAQSTTPHRSYGKVRSSLSVRPNGVSQSQGVNRLYTFSDVNALDPAGAPPIDDISFHDNQYVAESFESYGGHGYGGIAGSDAHRGVILDDSNLDWKPWFDDVGDGSDFEEKEEMNDHGSLSSPQSPTNKGGSAISCFPASTKSRTLMVARVSFFQVDSSINAYAEEQGGYGTIDVESKEEDALASSKFNDLISLVDSHIEAIENIKKQGGHNAIDDESEEVNELASSHFNELISFPDSHIESIGNLKNDSKISGKRRMFA